MSYHIQSCEHAIHFFIASFIFLSTNFYMNLLLNMKHVKAIKAKNRFELRIVVLVQSTLYTLMKCNVHVGMHDIVNLMKEDFF